MSRRHRRSRDALRARTGILPQAKSWRRADPLRPSRSNPKRGSPQNPKILWGGQKDDADVGNRAAAYRSLHGRAEAGRVRPGASCFCPLGPRTAGRARWRVQTISAGNFGRKAEFTSAAQVQSIRGSPRRAKPCGGVILHSLAPQLRLRKIPDFQRLFIILLNIEVCKLIFWGRYCVPFGWAGLFRDLGAQRPVGRLPGGGPRFSRETGGKRAGALCHR